MQQYTRVYSPPFDEFEVFHIALPSGNATIIPANPVCPPMFLHLYQDSQGDGAAAFVKRLLGLMYSEACTPICFFGDDKIFCLLSRLCCVSC